MVPRFIPFNCTVCQERFTTVFGRAQHQRVVHGLYTGIHFVSVSVLCAKTFERRALAGSGPFAF